MPQDTNTNTNTTSGAADLPEARLFTKKPVTIAAIQWTGKNLREVIAFTDAPLGTRTTHAGMDWEAYTDLVARDGLKIYTLEGTMRASPGDWIIRGVKGEYYPCKPDIFEATYSPAALAAGQATAAQAVVQDDLITIRKPTTRAEMLWLLKLAHLVISDVDKTLEETFAPAQPTAQQGVAYAELPEYGINTASHAHFRVLGFTADQMRAFADATHAIRASHGQAPAETGNSVSAQTDSVLYDPNAVLDVFHSARAGSEKPVGYLRGILAVIAHWESRPEPHRWMWPAPAARPAQEAEPLLDYAMQIAHERELRVTGFPHDEDGAKRVFEAAVMRHTATGAAEADSVQEDAAREAITAARARLLDSDLSQLTERGAKAWAGVDAQGLRDGGASPSANAGQADEYPALVCDYCGALTPDPWHSSGMLHGKMSKHIHSCDACAARGQAPAQPEQAAPKQSRADLEAENERLRKRLEEMVNTFCSVENVANEHYLQVLRDAIATRESTK